MVEAREGVLYAPDHPHDLLGVYALDTRQTTYPPGAPYGRRPGHRVEANAPWVLESARDEPQLIGRLHSRDGQSTYVRPVGSHAAADGAPSHYVHPGGRRLCPNETRDLMATDLEVRGTYGETCGPGCLYCQRIEEASRTVRSWDWPWWRRVLDRVPGLDMDPDRDL